MDLFGDEVDSIRTFDPDTQRSLYPVPEVRLLPGREFPMDEPARNAFRARWREKIEGDPSRSRIYKDIGAGLATAGIEYYLPLFFEQTATIFDYLGDDAALVLHGDVDDALQHFWTDTRERHRFLQHDPERPLLPPEALFLRIEEFHTHAHAHATLALRGAGEVDWARPLPDVSVDRGATEPLAALEQLVDRTPHRTLLVAESEGRRESLLELLRDHRIDVPSVASLAEFEAGHQKVAITAAPLAAGFHWHEPAQGRSIQFITETELFATTPQARRRRKQEQTSNVDALIKDLSELKIGDPVVHAQHGIGRYQGLKNIDLGPGEGGASEFLHLEYADKALLYVPVSQLHLISRYTGVSAEEAPLHRLGSGQWDKARRKAAEQVRDTAAELLNLYARRAAREGMSHPFSGHDYEAFAASFGFEETADQRAAIHAVIQDMVSPKPMDRLVCGDVGFGKTEVALRAAFVAVHGGKQVAILAPTTLLAEQHYQTLVDRFGKWPVKVAELSRFRSAKEVAVAMQGIGDGSIDIVVGTHKLLSPTVKFKRLGLLIIDEEHRFGVRHKEAMKALRAEVDVLTLTATPIPRTLGMALEGLRDLSVIATAPQRRLAIKTFVRSESNSVIREAVLRELKRGGQVYFLHNEVETIQNRARQLEALLPEARIAVAHGQLPERELERVMREFIAQRHNLLLCSTIIETGIDVPTANTIVMSAGRQVRPGATAPVARPRRPQPPPGLCLPAGARLAGPDQAGGDAAGRDPADGRAGLGLLPGDARPGNPRRRRGAGRKPERQHARGRLPALQRHAGRGGECAAGRPRARPAEPVRRHHRDQPARARAAARRLLRRRAHAAQPVQAPGHGRARRANRCPAGRDHRPLRQAAGAGPDAVRHAPAARAGQALRRAEDRRRTEAHVGNLPPEPAGRRRGDHRAGAEEPPHQAGRQREAAHRARDRRPGAACGLHARPVALAGQAGGAGRGGGPMSATEFASGLWIRGLKPPLRLSDYKLVAFDMDSTLINIECVDEIADVAGRKAEVAQITEAAMRGEIADYKDSLRRRVALLAGVSESALQQVYDERLQLNPGVPEFVRACQVAGLKTLLISGGFTFFSERIRQHLKLDFARANTLGVFNGRLTGTLFDRPWGDIVDGAEKKRVLLEVCELMGIGTEQAIAVGDGANDLPMMMAAGLSIAYHPKPAVREKALISIMSGGMERALQILR